MKIINFTKRGISAHFYREAKFMAAMPFVLIGLDLLIGLLAPRAALILRSAKLGF